MAVSVISPGRKQEFAPRQEPTVDPLDQILKGLQIASTVYGIKHNIDQNDLSKAKAESDRLKLSADQEFKTKDMEFKTKDMEFQRKQGGYMLSNQGELAIDPNSWKAKEIELQRKALEKKSEVDPLTIAIKEQTLSDKKIAAEEKAKKTAYEKTTEGRFAKLPATAKERLDNARGALQAVQGMAGALGQEQNTFSLIGDNDFTQQRNIFEESLGRMQSGGAITKHEEVRFKNMAPTLLDSAEMRQTKLNSLQAEFSKRIETLGFKPQDLGVEMQDISQSVPKGKSFMDMFSFGKPDMENAKIVNPMDDIGAQAAAVLKKRAIKNKGILGVK